MNISFGYATQTRFYVAERNFAVCWKLRYLIEYDVLWILVDGWRGCYVMCVPATPRHFPLFAASKNHVARDWTLKKIFRPSFFQNKIFRGAARALKKMACEEDDD